MKNWGNFLRMSPCQPPPVTTQYLTKNVARAHDRYFGGALLPIDLVWSRRLTSSVGMFVGRRGPRPRLNQDGTRAPTIREIRLSLPLLQQADQASEYGVQEIVNTLAHEMIHQWQYDILKRRPNHGPDFLRKMTELNRTVPWQLPSTIRYRTKCSRSRDSPGVVGDAATCTGASDGRFSPTVTIAVSVGVFYKNWGRSVGSSPNRRRRLCPSP